MSKNTRQLSTTIPIALSDKLEKAVRKNGYDRAWITRTALHMFLELSHNMRVKKHNEYLRSESYE